METFYALEPCWLSLDRFYKVYADDNALYGAVLAGQVYDETSAQLLLIAPAPFLAPLTTRWAERLLNRREEREQKYDQMDPTSAQFLRENKHNFWILKKDILTAEIRKKGRTVWTWSLRISGLLRITTKDRRVKKFILVGHQDVDSISAMVGNGRFSRNLT